MPIPHKDAVIISPHDLKLKGALQLAATETER